MGTKPLRQASHRRPIRACVTLLVPLISLWLAPATPSPADTFPQPLDYSHNALEAPAPITGAAYGTGATATNGVPICSTAASSAVNVNTSCEHNGPHNETSIAVNPANPANILGGANDYQLILSSGGHVKENVLSRAHVSFDSGATWTEYPVNTNAAYQVTGDPSVAFDNAGHAYYATLGFRFVSKGYITNPDVLVSNSTDGGRSWTTSRIASGTGSTKSAGDLLDKEYLTAWGNGNAAVTYGDYRFGSQGTFTDAVIYSSVTHNAGATWSTPTVISATLNAAYGSMPVHTADGRLFATFFDTRDLNTGRDTLEVVELDPATGALIAGPFDVAQAVNGATDYPLNTDNRQTYQDSQFRTSSEGDIAADPTNPAHLAEIWSDMRNSITPAPADPYQAVTNSDIIVSQSYDHGRTWSAAAAIPLPGDQFMPWAVFDPTGTLRIGTFDRSGDPANHSYDYVLLTQTPTGYSRSVVSTRSSDPTSNTRWFSGATPNPAFPHPTRFIGDYSNITDVPGTTQVLAYWTDLREQVCFAGRCGSAEDAYFARVG